MSMMNAEGTIKQPQFRLKIDLSKFFHDARQFCWIFIDGTKIQQVIHIQQHISNLFNITEPFHLLLNDTEFLPPTEDVRILKENETIQVLPGSGIKHKIDKAETCNSSMHDKQVHMTDIKTGSDIKNEVDNAETCNSFMHDKQVHMTDIKTEIVTSDVLNVPNNIVNNTQSSLINDTTENMTFYSVIDDTVKIIDDTKDNMDSKVTDNNLMKNCNFSYPIIPIGKRSGGVRRSRRRLRRKSIDLFKALILKQK
ncbi:unnamed protein product [Lasius platythorax]|uniref:Coilin N-terminal domain-containing protein n=1 Tax=Lasius platythorax TaxID=488582 RepID=A0AAV2NWW2_9HYME